MFDFSYIDCDVPEGMSLGDWRRAVTARASKSRLRVWLRVLRAPASRRLSAREALRGPPGDPRSGGSSGGGLRRQTKVTRLASSLPWA
jgi:hypothetical protein